MLVEGPPIPPFLGIPNRDTLRLTQMRSVQPYGSGEEIDPLGLLRMPVDNEGGAGVTSGVELEAGGLPNREMLRLAQRRSEQPYGSVGGEEPLGMLVPPGGRGKGGGVSAGAELEAVGLPNNDTPRLRHTRSVHP